MTYAIHPTGRAVAPVAVRQQPQDRHEEMVDRLIRRLPVRVQRLTRWTLQPSSRWIRIPAGVLLVCGGLLSILPFLGIWMLPLGLLLLAEDLPPLKRLRNWLLDFAQRRKPNWFVSTDSSAASADQGY